MNILELVFWSVVLVAAHFALRRFTAKTRRLLFMTYGFMQIGFELNAMASGTERPVQIAPMLMLGAIAVAYALRLRDAKRA